MKLDKIVSEILILNTINDMFWMFNGKLNRKV